MTKLPLTLRADLLARFENILYTPPADRLQTELEAIIADNSQCYDNEQLVLIYRGEIFADRKRTGKYPSPINILHREIRPRMKAFIARREKIDVEKQLALGYIQRIMTFTVFAEDYYALLPRSLHPEMRKLDRHFLSGPGLLASDEAEQFLADNHKFILALKTRMTMNLVTGK